MIGLAVTCLLLGGAALFARTADALPTTSPPAASAGPATTPPPSPAPSPAEPSTSAPAATPAPGEPSRPTSGPGSTEAGLWLRAAPAGDGSFQVVELIMLPAPVSKITLRPLAGSRSSSALRPSARSVQLSADDHPVLVPDGPIARATVVEWGFPADRVELRYTLAGVAERSRPSKPGRALATLGPLTELPPRLPVIMQIAGEGILSLDCFRLPAAERSCASGRPPELRTARPLPAEDAVVRVQYDLPLPG